jgi:hypothetical protein
MEPSLYILIQWILSGLLIAFFVTFPLLLGLIFLSTLSRSVKKDRQVFEERVLSLLEEIRNAQRMNHSKHQ